MLINPQSRKFVDKSVTNFSLGERLNLSALKAATPPPSNNITVMNAAMIKHIPRRHSIAVQTM